MCWPRDKGVGQNGGWKIQRTSLRDLEMHQSRDNVCVGSCSSKPKLYPEKSYKGLSPWTGAGWGGQRHWQISNKMEIFLRKYREHSLSSNLRYWLNSFPTSRWVVNNVTSSFSPLSWKLTRKSCLGTELWEVRWMRMRGVYVPMAHHLGK